MRQWDLSTWSKRELANRVESSRENIAKYKDLLDNAKDSFEASAISSKLREYEIDLVSLKKELEKRQ